MTEITRVPLPPLAKGALGKMWLGLAAVMLAGAGLANCTKPAHVTVTPIKEGTGAAVTAGSVPVIRYVGKLKSGTVFDVSPQEMPMPLDQTIPGFRDGLVKMRVGGVYQLLIPAELAYGKRAQKDPQTGREVIPASSELDFEVTVMDVWTAEKFQQFLQYRQMLQQQMQMQQRGGGNPHAPQ